MSPLSHTKVLKFISHLRVNVWLTAATARPSMTADTGRVVEDGPSQPWLTTIFHVVIKEGPSSVIHIETDINVSVRKDTLVTPDFKHCLNNVLKDV